MGLITTKLAVGAVWNAASQFGAQGVNFVVTLVLAALLAPSAFGLVGMVTVFTGFFSYLTEFGLTPSLIQKKEIDEVDEHTVFWTTVGLSVVLYGLVFLGAPLIGRFYREPQLVPMVRVLFATFLFSPLVLVPEAILKKRLDYPTIAQAELVGTVVSGLVAVGMAIAGLGVWSLVFQPMVRTLVKGVGLWIKTKWRPRFIFSVPRLRELLSFGIMFTANNLLVYVAENVHYLIVGRLIGSRALGLYTLAFRISKYPFMKGWQVFGQMLFPAFAQIRENRERLLRSYRKSDGFAVVVLVPLLVAVFAGVDSFVVAIIGSEWEVIQPIVRFLVAYMVVFSLALPDVSVLLALGKVRAVVLYKVVYGAALAVLGYVATTDYGVIGMAAAYSGVSMVYATSIKFKVKSELGLSSVAALLPNWRVLMGAVGSVAGAVLANVFLRPGLLHLGVLGLVIAGAVCAQLVALGVVNLRAKSLHFDMILPAHHRPNVHDSAATQ